MGDALPDKSYLVADITFLQMFFFAIFPRQWSRMIAIKICLATRCIVAIAFCTAASKMAKNGHCGPVLNWLFISSSLLKERLNTAQVKK